MALDEYTRRKRRCSSAKTVAAIAAEAAIVWAPLERTPAVVDS